MFGSGAREVDDDSPKQETGRSRHRFNVLEAQGFVVGKTLGNGSYGCVKSAYDIKKKHKVAIKIISKQKASMDYIQKFLPREIEIIRVMRHPSLIQFYQVIETTKRFFLIMEVSENGDLLEQIQKRKVIREDQAGKWMRNLVDGIAYIHSMGFAHRDIKCENLLINAQMLLKITDFGFAKKIDKGKGNDVALSSTYCGSYAYAPPEILTGIPYNPYTAEVWSMGVVLFTMVYGCFPFDDSNHTKLLKQVQQKICFPSKPGVSENCRILILKMLSKTSDRVPLGNIRYDAWYKEFGVSVLPTPQPSSCSRSTLCVPGGPSTSETGSRASYPSRNVAPHRKLDDSTDSSPETTPAKMPNQGKETPV